MANSCSALVGAFLALCTVVGADDKEDSEELGIEEEEDDISEIGGGILGVLLKICQVIRLICLQIL